MTAIEHQIDPQRIHDLFSTCFEGGERRQRELRLTEEEAQYAQTHFSAQLRPMGESWYEITFVGVG